MKLALWNDDTVLTQNLDLKGCYYKISIQHATTNIYIKQTTINTTKDGIISVIHLSVNQKRITKLKSDVSNFTYLKITTVEPGTHESGVITNWKRKKEKISDDSRKRKHSESSPDNESGKSTRNQ